MRTGIAAAVWMLVSLGSTSTARADDKPLDRVELDKRIAKVAYNAAVSGTELFNKGDTGGCFRLYQGTLQAVLPMLDHQPKLAGLVKEKLEKAKEMKPVDGAFVLRDAIDALMGQTKAAAKPATLWDRLGGEKVVRAVVHDVFLAAAADPKVNFTRGGPLPDEKAIAHLEQLLVEFISSATGGPLKYTGKDMKTAHMGMKITDEEFDALGGHIVAVLKKYKVPQTDIDDFMKIINSTKKDIVEVPKK